MAFLQATAWARLGLPRSGLLALTRRQLGRTLGSKVGAVGAALVVLVVLGLGLAPAESPRGADWLVLARHAAGWLCWLGAGPLLLAAAGPRAARDRLEGIELLAAARGHDPAALARARTMAAIVAATVRIGLPSVGLCFGAATLGGRAGFELLPYAIALAMFALLAGAVLGGLAALCSELGRGRGRALLLSVMLVPWAVGDRAGHPEWSIPGALGRALVVLAPAGAAQRGAP